MRFPRRLAQLVTVAITATTMATVAAVPAQAAPAAHRYKIHTVLGNSEVNANDCVGTYPSAGTAITEYCASPTSKIWVLEYITGDVVRVRHEATGLYLAIKENDPEGEPAVAIVPKAESRWQQWRMSLQGHGSLYPNYSVINMANGKYMSHPAHTTVHAAPYYGPGVTSQKWAFETVF